MRASLNASSFAVLCMASGFAQQQPGSPPAPSPITASRELVLLGKMLFWEEQLSSDDSMACGTCHRPATGGADPRPAALHPGPDAVFGTADDVHGSLGMVRTLANRDFAVDAVFGLHQLVTRRSAPSVIGAAAAPSLHWDGAVDGRLIDPLSGAMVIASGAALEQQALRPLLDPGEMGHVGRNWKDVTAKLAAVRPMHLASALPADVQSALLQSPNYAALFAIAFGDGEITPTRIAMALAGYVRSLRADATAWDRFAAGDPHALDRQQHAGWKLFVGKAGCASCHPAPHFTDHLFHNLGLRPASDDPGRVNVDPAAVPGAFRTPTLRNVGLRRRLFHNGQSPALDDVQQLQTRDSALMVHWHGGGRDRRAVDPLLLPLQANGVTLAEIELVFAFVRTALTDARVAAEVAPFDHPELRSVREAIPRIYGQPLAGTSEPFLIDWVPAWPGNNDFRLGLVGGLHGSVAVLAIGFQSFEPAVVVQSLPFHLAPLFWQSFVMQAAPGEPGHTTWHVALPSDPALATIPLYYQMVVDDPVAPGGIAASRGVEFFIR